VRGAGLSERHARKLGVASCVDDLTAVANAARFDGFSIVALGYGVNLALAFAAAHPTRVRKLVCYGGAARGRFRRGVTPAQRDDLNTVLTMLSGHDDRPGYGFVFRRTFYEQFVPDASLALLEALDRIIVARFSGTVARDYAADLFDLDQSAIAAQLQVPTLVLHAKRDRFCPFDEGQRMAALIPDAKLVAIDSDHSLPLASDADWLPSARLIDEFLCPDAGPPMNALTRRQVEVLKLVALGRTDKQIARALDLSHRTVEMHVARALAALGCHTRAEAVARSSELRLL
jgi:pimeloyl-ACP methyl ester carboxylesterase/DNA-binding CsgD family transcriptional regulator